MQELETGYRFREPASKTIKFMEEQIKFNQQMQMSVNDMKHDIKSICEKLEQHTVDQKEQFLELNTKIDGFISSADSRYAEKKLEHIINKILWIFFALVVGALGAAFFKLVLK